MALKRRVEVLFDGEQYAKLERVAQAEGKSVGALVRRAVEQQYLGPTLEQRKAAVQWLVSQQSDVTWEEAKKLIEGEVGRQLDAP